MYSIIDWQLFFNVESWVMVQANSCDCEHVVKPVLNLNQEQVTRHIFAEMGVRSCNAFARVPAFLAFALAFRFLHVPKNLIPPAPVCGG